MATMSFTKWVAACIKDPLLSIRHIIRDIQTIIARGFVLHIMSIVKSVNDLIDLDTQNTSPEYYTHTIGRSAIFGREIGVPDKEGFSWQKIFNFSVKNCYLQHRRSP